MAATVDAPPAAPSPLPLSLPRSSSVARWWRRASAPATQAEPPIAAAPGRLLPLPLPLSLWWCRRGGARAPPGTVVRRLRASAPSAAARGRLLLAASIYWCCDETLQPFLGCTLCLFFIRVPELDLRTTFVFTFLGLHLVGPALHVWLVTINGASGAIARVILGGPDDCWDTDPFCFKRTQLCEFVLTTSGCCLFRTEFISILTVKGLCCGQWRQDSERLISPVV